MVRTVLRVAVLCAVALATVSGSSANCQDAMAGSVKQLQLDAAGVC